MCNGSKSCMSGTTALQDLPVAVSTSINNLSAELGDQYASKLSTTSDHIIAAYLIFLCAGGVFLNGTVLLTLLTKRGGLTCLDLCLINLTVSDMCPAILAYPVTISALYSHRWNFSNNVCQMIAFLVFFFGVASIGTLTVMSFMRYVKTCWSLLDKAVTRKVTLYLILGVYVNASVWSLAPLLGWGRYALAPFGSACSLSWVDLPVSYTACIFTFAFVLPLACMLYCYGRMIHTVCGAKKNISLNLLNKPRMDIYLTRMVALMCFAFVFAWTPYAILSFWYTRGGHGSVNVEYAAIPSLFAKSSGFYNPIIYFLIIKRLRARITNVMCRLCLGPVRQEETGGYTGIAMGTGYVSSAISRKKYSQNIDTQHDSVKSPNVRIRDSFIKTSAVDPVMEDMLVNSSDDVQTCDQRPPVINTC